MEEWLDFVDAFSPHVLRDLPWDEDPEQAPVRQTFEDMWYSLRQAVLYFMKFHEGQHTPELILEAQEHLLQYGKLAEAVRPTSHYAEAYDGRQSTLIDAWSIVGAGSAPCTPTSIP